MMAVIVEHRDAIVGAGPGEAALDAGEALESLPDVVVGHAEFLGDGKRRRGVQRIVITRNGECQIADIVNLAGAPIGHAHREAGFPVLVAHLHQAHVGLRAPTIGDDATVAHLADHLLHHRMVDAHDGEAIEGNILDEGEEGLLRLVEGTVMVKVLGVDIGDDHHIRRKLHEGAIGLIRLDDHPVALAEPRIGAIGIDDAAIDDGRVEVACVQQRGHK